MVFVLCELGSPKGFDEPEESNSECSPSERVGELMSCSAKLAEAFSAAPRVGRILSASISPCVLAMMVKVAPVAGRVR
jgi:hypothetical protein